MEFSPPAGVICDFRRKQGMKPAKWATTKRFRRRETSSMGRNAVEPATPRLKSALAYRFIHDGEYPAYKVKVLHISNTNGAMSFHIRRASSSASPAAHAVWDYFRHHARLNQTLVPFYCCWNACWYNASIACESVLNLALCRDDDYSQQYRLSECTGEEPRIRSGRTT